VAVQVCHHRVVSFRPLMFIDRRLFSLIEVSTAGFPLPLRLGKVGEVVKEDWVQIRDSERMFARLTETSLVVSRDDKGTSIFRGSMHFGCCCCSCFSCRFVQRFSSTVLP